MVAEGDQIDARVKEGFGVGTRDAVDIRGVLAVGHDEIHVLGASVLPEIFLKIGDRAASDDVTDA